VPGAFDGLAAIVELVVVAAVLVELAGPEQLPELLALVAAPATCWVLPFSPLAACLIALAPLSSALSRPAPKLFFAALAGGHPADELTFAVWACAITASRPKPKPAPSCTASGT
jgi:hypothetical protein